MIAAVLRAMLLELLRDRAALILTFVLPAIFFVIFAQIFTAVAGGNLVVTAAIVDQVESPVSRALGTALRSSPRLRVVDAADPDAVVGMVRRGAADAGVVVEAGQGSADLELIVLTDPARGAAGQIVEGGVRVVLAEVLSGSAPPSPQAQRVEVVSRSVFATDRGVHEVAYAAGAVSFMFLLFASAGAAMSLMEERQSGIIDRVLAGPGGIEVLVFGKFLYLVAQGVVQVGVIFIIAWLGYGVALPAHIGAWLVVTMCAAAAAGGLSLLLVTASRTRRQAQTLATLAILVMSAVGGSMVPRYVMPPEFQSVGWLTPNTWALEAYNGIFWREEGLQSVVVPCLVLLAGGLLALGVALLLARAGLRR